MVAEGPGAEVAGEAHELPGDVAVPLLHPVIRAVGPPRDPAGRGTAQDQEADPGDGAGALCVRPPVRPGHGGQGGGLARLIPGAAYRGDRPHTPGSSVCNCHVG